MNILQIIESNDWQITLSEEINSDDGEKSILIEGDAHSFKMFAHILLDMARTVKEMPKEQKQSKKKQGYGVMISPEETSQLILPDADNLILECTTKRSKRKKKSQK